MSVLPLVEGIIGNMEEALELGRLMIGSTSITDTIRSILKCKGRGKFMIVTNASQPILMGVLKSDGDVKLIEVETPDVPKYMIKNANGAGDTLAGSTIGGLINGMNLIEATEFGQRFVSYYIQQSDGSYPINFT